MLTLSEKEKKILQELINGLPICKKPYYQIAKKLDTTEEEVIKTIRSLLEKGVIRRLGITLRHNLAGIEGNAMVAWMVPESRVEEIGTALASLPYISHCYLRETSEDWKYNLYTMIHAKNREEVMNLVKDISKRFNLPKYKVLFTKKEIIRKHACYFK